MTMTLSLVFLILGAIGGIISIGFAFYLWMMVKKLSTGEGETHNVYKAIREGAKAYIKREFKTIFAIAGILSIIIFFALDLKPWLSGLPSFVFLSFWIGTITSLAASFIGMDIATRTNVRVAIMAKQGLEPAMKTGFNGGTIMGMLVFGVNVIQIVITYLFLYMIFPGNYQAIVVNIVGCAFGGSFTSVIAQLGGGIYTKGADVGADIVGKIEQGIPEDDVRNPAVVADLVGDNVGDCAGRSADLYETLTSELISSMILGLSLFILPGSPLGDSVIFFPFLIRFIATIATIIGYFFVKQKKKIEAGETGPWKLLNTGLYLSSSIIAVIYVLLVLLIFQSVFLVFAAIFGIAANLIMGFIFEYFTSIDKKPVKTIIEASETGPATNIIQGMSNGLGSVFIPLSIIAMMILGAFGFGALFGVFSLSGRFILGGTYGIVIMSMGMTSGTGIILSMDGFGPIVDNAGGIAEMSGMGEDIRKNTDLLDATGNSTKSLTKGFSIISGTTIGFVTIFAYIELINSEMGITNAMINMGFVNVAVGGIFGVITVFLFVSLLMRSVGKTAHDMIEEVRRQFREIPGIMEWKEKPDYGRCVDISTISALKNMIFPALLIIIMPIAVGIFLGPFTLGAFLIIATFTGGAMGIFMNVSGASWDNAKKGRKHLQDKSNPETIKAYQAAVIGDTVGDPCKDTAGSSLGSFVTTINNLAITFFPLFVFTYGIALHFIGW
ncbi:MAG: sodium-translocating pyrophosphatase [Candidatus Lokiarchaeota archaeon]|nr:sodium-translocating pyrophosphatase [Candidatus Lokiarchaeota archaeon]